MDDATLQCELCPKRCVLRHGQRGNCRARMNLDGRLVALTYGFPCSVHVDPVEKKPLFHFLPGSNILSIATAGCNLHCRNCQNWEISQRNPEDVDAVALPPGAAVDLARRHGCPSIAYTYTDPAIYYEYALDTCRAAREAGLRNAAVTAGYMNPKPAREFYRWVDAANIDLKALSDDFYRDVCDGTLRPVLDVLVLAKSLGVELEVTHLVIPTLNDAEADLRALSRWVKEHLGADTPLHFSRFFPQYRMQHLPPTPADTLERASAIARAEGLRFVYVGNLATEKGEDTLCPGCGETLLHRTRFTVCENRLLDGRCPACGTGIPGVWR